MTAEQQISPHAYSKNEQDNKRGRLTRTQRASDRCARRGPVGRSAGKPQPRTPDNTADSAHDDWADNQVPVRCMEVSLRAAA